MSSIKEAESYNPWFTKENIENALKYWSKKLNIKTLEDWISKYEMKSNNSKVAIIMAGNFPLAGFHDFISVFLSGNIALVKPSSDDKILISFFINFLKTNYPKTNNLIQISQGKLIEFDMFFFFSPPPPILRKCALRHDRIIFSCTAKQLLTVR